MNTVPALLGGAATFEHPVKNAHVLPSWSQFEELVGGIFDRRYYTNHGPLALAFEKSFAEFFGVRNALYMTNSGIAAMIASRAIEVKGKVILPAFSHITMAQAVIWAGGEPVYCDVHRDTMHFDLGELERLVDSGTKAIFAANLFGGTCDCDEVDQIASKYNVPVYYLSDDAIGSQYKDRKVGNFGKLEIFSLHESKIINAVNGCVVTCNDDDLAEKMRHLRSSYGLGKPTPVEFTGNGRMSEIVAGMALLGLEKFETNVQQNQQIRDLYQDVFSSTPGIRLYEPAAAVTRRNNHRVVAQINKAEFGLSGSELHGALLAENIQVSMLNNFAQSTIAPYEMLKKYPVSMELRESILEFPLDRNLLKAGAGGKLNNAIMQIQSSAQAIKEKLK